VQEEAADELIGRKRHEPGLGMMAVVLPAEPHEGGGTKLIGSTSTKQNGLAGGFHGVLDDGLLVSFGDTAKGCSVSRAGLCGYSS
jgi:hypothetical protein